MTYIAIDVDNNFPIASQMYDIFIKYIAFHYSKMTQKNKYIFFKLTFTVIILIKVTINERGTALYKALVTVLYFLYFYKHLNG